MTIVLKEVHPINYKIETYYHKIILYLGKI